MITRKLLMMILPLFAAGLLIPAGTGYTQEEAEEAPSLTLYGKVINQSTGQTASVDSADLLDLSQGMELAESVEVSDGKYSFENIRPNRMYLLRVEYQGVTYNRMITPETGKGDLELDMDVYDMNDNLENIEAGIPHFLIERAGDILKVVCDFEVFNTGNTTLYSEKGAFRFYIPPNHELLALTVNTGLIPVEKDLVGTDQKNVYTIDQAFKPGQAKVKLAYSLPYKDEKLVFTSPFLFKITNGALILRPHDLKIESDQLELLEENHEIDYAAYSIPEMPAGSVFEFIVSGGSESARPMAPPTQEDIPPMGVLPEGHPPLEEGADAPLVPSSGNVSKYTGPILAAMIFLFFVVLFAGLRRRRHSADALIPAVSGTAAEKKSAEGRSKREDELLDDIADLDDLFEDNGISEEKYRAKRKAMMDELKSLKK